MPLPGTLVVPPRDVQVWWAQVPVGHLTDIERRALAASLDERALARTARFVRAQDRDRGLAAHALLRRLLAAVTGGTPAQVRLTTTCLACGSPDHGKPVLDTGRAGPPVQANLSHAGEVVAVALAAADRPVGIDVEQVRYVDWKALRRNVFDDEEWAPSEHGRDPDTTRLGLWTRKEAAVKATGHGLSLRLRDVRITSSDNESHDRRGGHDSERHWVARMAGVQGDVVGRDIPLTEGYVGAVAALRGGYGVTVHRVEL